jgi:hypothetical protein
MVLIFQCETESTNDPSDALRKVGKILAHIGPQVMGIAALSKFSI